jgi:2-oxoglutarate ferredoxin oxidoreductase subunit beta
MPNIFTSLMSDPKNILLLRHKNGMQVSDALAKLYPTHEEHDPSNIHRAREIAEREDKVPVGILYRNPAIQRYEETRKPARMPSWEQNQAVLEKLFDKHGIFPRAEGLQKGNGHGAR